MKELGELRYAVPPKMLHSYFVAHGAILELNGTAWFKVLTGRWIRFGSKALVGAFESSGRSIGK